MAANSERVDGPPAEGCTFWDPGQCQGTSFCPPRCPRFVDREGTPLLVSRYGPEDRASLVEMYDAMGTVSRTLGLPPGSPEAVEDWLDRLVERGWNLVARDGDTVVGHVAVAPADSEDPGIVVFVRESHQGRGIGTELMKQVVAHAAAEGYEALTLEVALGNRRAIAVYENLQFRVDERTIGELEMRLPLDDPVADEVRLPPAER